MGHFSEEIEIRNVKLETSTNTQNMNVPNNSNGVRILKCELVSDFKIQITDPRLNGSSQ